MIDTLGRGGGRSWPVVFFASLVALVVAAVMLLGGGTSARPAAELAPVAAPAPTPTSDPATAPDPGAAATPEPGQPRWSGQAARSGPVAGASPAPIRLLVPRFDLDMAIVATGISGDGLMALPEQPSEIGWYRYGPRPGDAAGSAVLAGHVDSRRFGIGPLAELRKLGEGDRIVVQSEGGQQTYEVRQVAQISKRVVPLGEVFVRSGPATLRIVTCGGPYDRSRGGYLDNVVVTAVPL